MQENIVLIKGIVYRSNAVEGTIHENKSVYTIYNTLGPQKPYLVFLVNSQADLSISGSCCVIAGNISYLSNKTN